MCKRVGERLISGNAHRVPLRARVREQPVVFEASGLHCRTPDSGELQHKSRETKKRFDATERALHMRIHGTPYT